MADGTERAMTATVMASEMFTRGPSRVHGLGVFTNVAIAQGTAVFEFGGPVIRGEQITPEMRVMQVGPDAYVAEDIAADYIENYINHCCEPNLGFTHGTLTLHALRDIAAGEELFWDYSTSIHDPDWCVPCGCGARGCRRIIRGYASLSEADRRRLAPMTLAYLR